MSSLRTQVRRLSQAWMPPGHVVVIQAHACQTAVDLEAQARTTLGRTWRASDLLITIEVDERCPTCEHQHNDPIITHARME